MQRSCLAVSQRTSCNPFAALRCTRTPSLPPPPSPAARSSLPQSSHGTSRPTRRSAISRAVRPWSANRGSITSGWPNRKLSVRELHPACVMKAPTAHAHLRHPPDDHKARSSPPPAQQASARTSKATLRRSTFSGRTSAVDSAPSGRPSTSGR